jgi:hypothetical protein
MVASNTSVPPNTSRLRRVACSLAVMFSSMAISCDLPNDPAQGESPQRAKSHEKSNGKSHETSHEHSSHQHADHDAPASTTQRDAGVAWYLTLHDAGARDPVTGQESVFGFGSDGSVAGGVLSKVPDEEGALQDLRGMLPLSDGSLLVISAWKHNTQILRFGPPNADARRPFLDVFTRSGDHNPLLIHPYAMAIASDGSILVSNQDSNTVTRYGAPNTAKSGQPLTRTGEVDTGSKNAGLAVPSHEMEKHGIKEVRGIACAPDGTLLVADRGKGEVSQWNLSTGERLRVVASKSDGIETPIQLLLAADGDTLYISDNKRNEVFVLRLSGGRASVFLDESAGIDATSSLALHDGYLYVGSRKGREILRFRSADGSADAKPFIANLPDNPEFFVPSMKQTP